MPALLVHVLQRFPEGAALVLELVGADAADALASLGGLVRLVAL